MKYVSIETLLIIFYGAGCLLIGVMMGISFKG
jgi:hypothetical protein